MSIVHYNIEDVVPLNDNLDNTLILIDIRTSNAIEKFINLFNNNFQNVNNKLIVSWNKTLLDNLSSDNRNGEIGRFAENLIDRSEIERIDDVSYNIIKKWYKNISLKTHLNFKGINLGNLLEFDLSHYLPFVLKKIYLAKKYINICKADKVILFVDDITYDSWHGIYKTVGEFHNNQIEIVFLSKNINHLIIFKDTLQKFILNTIKCFMGTFLNVLNIFVSFFQINRFRLKNGKKCILIQNSSRLSKISSELESKKEFNILRFEQKISLRSIYVFFSNMSLFFSIFGFKNNISLSSLYSPKYTKKSNTLFTVLKDDQELQKILYFDEIPLWPIIEKKMEYFIYKIFPEYKLTITQIINNLTALRPDLILLQLDTCPFERALCYLAHQKGIPTMVVQHGIQAERRGHDKIYAEKYLVWGAAHKERYITWGNAPDKIVVTGNPEFDRFNSTHYDYDQIKDTIISKLGLNKEKKIIVFATRSNWENYWFSAFRFTDSETMHFRELVKALDSMDTQCQLILKVHPGEIHDDIYQKVLDDLHHKLSVTITKDIGLDNLLVASDLLVSTGSTVALEALILKKQVVIINFTSRQDLIPYVNSNNASGIYDKQKLSKYLSTTISSKGNNYSVNDQFIHDYAFSMDGNSTKRVMDEIKKMIDK